MAIISGIPVLHCKNIEQTRLFYQQLLQFVVVKKREEKGVLTWVHLMHGDTTLMLQSTTPPASKISVSKNSNISLFFFVNNIIDLHHFVKAKNRNVSEIKQTDYQMQEFTLLDPEGNTLTIGMSLKQES